MPYKKIKGFCEGADASGECVAGKWDFSLISRIQQANDIVDVISEHLNLEKKGKELVGLCPFHADHKPSLLVNPAKQIFKCFACGAGGDVLKFVQMKENLTFPQSVERLAQRAGITIEPVRSRREGGQTSELDAMTLSKMNAWALSHWISNLWHPQKGVAARAYLAGRKITEAMAKKWQLGLAVDAWDDLAVAAAAKKIGARRLIEAGLAVEKESGGGYDKFRNRLMFPIFDVTGRVTGFGGRTLGEDPAKYMNSPATALFDKSHLLYGLDQARQAITQTGTAVVVEGYTDVMIAHQFGIGNVVAALGTSLTGGHARLLKRYGKRIVLVFDSDVAGKAAANRALEVCLAEKVDVRLAFVPSGKDPCEYLLEAGAEAFGRVIDSAVDVIEFKWNVLEEQLKAGQNLSDRTEAIRQFLQTAASAFSARQMDSVSRTVVLSRLSELLNIPAGRIEDEIAKIQKQRQQAQRQNEAPKEGLGQSGGQDLMVRTQREILEVLLHEPSCFMQVRQRMCAEDFGPDGPVREIADALFGLMAEGIEPSMARLYGRVESPASALVLAELDAQGHQKGGDSRQRLEMAMRVLEGRKNQQQLEQLKQRLDEDSELKKMLKQIAQKGPDLRKAGI
ncbi:MAG: DNA primase [Planctomycetales bacterium]|nr:DNA primase [Planctomycetales bacterium]